MNKIVRFIGCLILTSSFLVLASSAFGQDANTTEKPKSSSLNKEAKSKPISLGKAWKFNSTALGEERTINVWVPPGYEKSKEKKRYDVIYFLDGAVSEDYHHITGLAQFFHMYRLMPETIWVGIANTDRKRDMTFPTKDKELLEAIPNCGGSKNFRKFITAELIPFIESKYKCNKKRTLIGQSLGGLLCTEVFLKDTKYFDNFIIVSPSLWWDNRSLTKSIIPFLKENQELKKNVFIALGTEGNTMQQVADSLVDGLKKHAGEGVNWKFRHLPKETHATVLHRSLYAALEFMYEDRFPGL